MALSENMKKHLSNVARVGFSVALLLFLATKIDFAKTWNVVRAADPWFLFWAFVTFMLINFVLILRWMIYVRALELKVPFKIVLRYFFIGLFGNLFLPTSIGGDVLKTIGLCRYSADKPKVVASVLLDRLSGFGGMVVVATVSLLAALPFFRDAALLLTVCGMAIGAGLVGMVLFNEKWYAFCCQIFSPFPKLKQALMQIHYDVVLLKDRPMAVVQAIGVSCLAQLTFAGTFYCLARALFIDVNFLYMVIFVPLICLAASFPSIGGLGVREAGVAYLFAKIGIDFGLSVSISLMNFVFMVLGGLAGGVVYLATKAPKAQTAAEVVSENPAV